MNELNIFGYRFQDAKRFILRVKLHANPARDTFM